MTNPPTMPSDPDEERVARAIAAVDRETCFEREKPGSDALGDLLLSTRCTRYREYAQAALAALRSPPSPGDEIQRLRALVTELADELEAEVKARYAGMLPQLTQHYAVDMEPVTRARSALSDREVKA